jgi:hypothetical protein
MDKQLGQSRSSFLRVAAGAGALVLAGVVFARGSEPSEAAPSEALDLRIFEFALQLEYLQAAFYTEATAHGALRGDLRAFAEVVGRHERAHVAFLQQALGPAATPAPAFHFGNATRDPARFAAAARELENIGVGAYNGQGARLTRNAMIKAAEIVSVEGRHAAWISALVGEAPAPRAADPGVTAAAVMAQVQATGFLG